MTTDEESRANIEQFANAAEIYDRWRPRPPPDLARLLLLLARTDRPALVVDLGSGTGLSSRIWSGRADRVIGIEPGEEMRRMAERRTSDPSIEYRAGTAEQTGLPTGSADIVTASQSFHWMAPEPTLAEVARILRPGGVFAAVDCRWPVTVEWEAEQAEIRFMNRARAGCEAKQDVVLRTRARPKTEHLTRIRASGRFRYAKEVTLHHFEEGGVERLLGLARSHGHVQRALRAGLSDEEIGFPEFRAEIERLLAGAPRTWHVSYDVRYGIR